MKSNLPPGCTPQMVEDQCDPSPNWEADADQIDWNEEGEKAIRNMSESDKADFFNKPEWQLAIIFDHLIMSQTDWTPLTTFNSMLHRSAIDLDVMVQLETLRDQQAELARNHFLETGELE